MGDDQFYVARLIAPRHVDLAGQDDDEAVGDMARREQRLAGGVGANLSETAYPFEFQRIELGKHLIAPPVDDRLWGQCHDDIRRLQLMEHDCESANRYPR